MDSALASFFHAAIWILLRPHSLSSSSSSTDSSSVLGALVEAGIRSLMAAICSSVAITLPNHSVDVSLGGGPGGMKALITCANVCDACAVAPLLPLLWRRCFFAAGLMSLPDSSSPLSSWTTAAAAFSPAASSALNPCDPYTSPTASHRAYSFLHESRLQCKHTKSQASAPVHNLRVHCMICLSDASSQAAVSSALIT